MPRPFRSFAFITFEDPDVAASLLGQEQVINGQTLTVGSAVPKMPAFLHHAQQQQQQQQHGAHGNHSNNLMYQAAAAAAAAAQGGAQGLPWAG